MKSFIFNPTAKNENAHEISSCYLHMTIKYFKQFGNKKIKNK